MNGGKTTGKIILIDEELEDNIYYAPGNLTGKHYWYIELHVVKKYLLLRQQIVLPFRYKGMPLRIQK